MDPLTEELFEETERQYKAFEENIKSRVLYIVNYMAKKKGYTPYLSIDIFASTIFELAVGKYNKDIINVHGYDFCDTRLLWNNKEILFPYQIPVVWLKWNFEDEVEDGIKEYLIKIKTENYDKAYEIAKKRHEINVETVHQAEIDYIKELAAIL